MRFGCSASTLWPVLVLLLLLAPPAEPRAHADSAGRDFKAGAAAESRDDVIAAFQAYRSAFRLRPSDLRFRTAYERLRVAASAEYVKQGERLAADNNPGPALAAFLLALDADPGNELAQSDARRLEHTPPAAAAPQPQPAATGPEGPAQLDISTRGPVTLHMVQDSRIVYEAIGKTLGVNVLFDPAYSSKRIQVDLEDVTPWQALSIVAKISGTFWEPVTHNTIFIAEDTRPKRQELAEQAVEVFYLKNVSEQNDFTEIQTVLRNLFQTARINGVASDNAIVMRATPAELQLAKMLIAGLDEPKPEVLVDIAVMEVSRDKMREIGLSPPTSFTVTSGSSQTLEQIGHTSSYSITVGQAAAEFLLTDSDTRILQNPRLRALDGQKADLKLGEKLPVATGSYTIPTSTTSAAAETQFQYLDVGVNVEMTPRIHGDHDVTLKLDVEVSSSTSTETIDGVAEPVISQEKTDQVIRLKDGESTILAGLVKKEIAHTVSGWPGFGEIPLLKYFFSTQQHEVTTDDLVFMITPHIVRAPAFDTQVEREIDTGTENGIALRLPPAGSSSGQQP